MYDISSAYIEAVQASTRTDAIVIEMYTEDLVLSCTLTDEDIESGTVSVARQCVNNTYFEWGAVYSSSLSFQTRSSSVSVFSVCGMYCKVYYKIKLANGSWETVPVGVFRVSEGTLTRQVLTITAYDCLSLLDKDGLYWDVGETRQPYTHLQNALLGNYTWYSANGGTPIDITLGNTQSEIEALPNGQLFVPIPDLTTPREYISAVAEILGCYVEADRETPNQIVLKQFSTETCRTIEISHRFEYSISVDWDRPSSLSSEVYYDDYGSELSASYNYVVEGETGASVTGFYRILMDNAILNLSGESKVKQVLNNLISLLEVLNAGEYLPISFTMPVDPSLDPGDMLRIYYGSTSNRLLVGGVSWRYRNQETVTAIGGNKLTSIANAATSGERNATKSLNSKISALQKQVDTLKEQIGSTLSMSFSDSFSLAVTDGVQLSSDFLGAPTIGVQTPTPVSLADTWALQVSETAAAISFGEEFDVSTTAPYWLLDTDEHQGTYDSSVITIGTNGYVLVDEEVSGTITATADCSAENISGIAEITASYSGGVTISYSYDNEMWSDAIDIAEFLEMGDSLYAGLGDEKQLYLQVTLTGDATFKSLKITFTE